MQLFGVPLVKRQIILVISAYFVLVFIGATLGGLVYGWTHASQNQVNSIQPRERSQLGTAPATPRPAPSYLRKNRQPPPAKNRPHSSPSPKSSPRPTPSPSLSPSPSPTSPSPQLIFPTFSIPPPPPLSPLPTSIWS